jgi:hypothetical protein
MSQRKSKLFNAQTPCLTPASVAQQTVDQTALVERLKAEIGRLEKINQNQRHALAMLHRSIGYSLAFQTEPLTPLKPSQTRVPARKRKKNWVR